MLNLIEWARRYRELGLHPIPIEARGKRPLVPWKAYQDRAPTDAELELWFGRSDGNVGLVLGRGVMAVDLDGGKAAETLLVEAGVTLPPEAPRVRTAAGYHVYLAAKDIPDCVAMLCGAAAAGAKAPQVDIRGVGYVVAPPSVHPSGAAYEWVVPFEEFPPAAPAALLALIKARHAPPAPPGQGGDRWIAQALQGVGEGTRDATCAKLAGYLLGKGVEPDIAEGILLAYAAKCTPPMAPAEVRKTVTSIARRTVQDLVLAPMPIAEVAHQLERRMTEAPPRFIPTGLGDLDYYMSGGVEEGELVYLGARPGVGKTALALQLAAHAARAGTNILVVSLEMTALALMRRMVAQHGRIHARSLRRFELDEQGRTAVHRVLAELGRLPVWFVEDGLRSEGYGALVERFTAKHGPSLVVVDHLQHLRSARRYADRRAEVEEVSSVLRTTAKRLAVPTICLSQLTRPKDKKYTKPSLDDLRESGMLEADAHVVLLMDRDFGSAQATVRIAKNRDGHTGEVALTFEKDYMSFAMAEEHVENDPQWVRDLGHGRAEDGYIPQ